jgi:RND family efflux transporter MFP subunit
MLFRYPFVNVGLGLGAALVWWSLAGCTAEAREGEAQARPASKPEVGAKQATSGTTDSPAPAATRSGALEIAGDLRPDQAADLSFKISGQLLFVRVQRGDRVRKGQLLATLSDAESRAQLAQTEAAIVQAEAQLGLARDNEARAASLVAANAAPGSQATVVRLQTAIARAALAQAVAARDLAAATLANHQLKAPFDGALVKVPDGVGQIVAPGVALFRLETLDKLVLRSTINEADVDRVKVGDEVAIDTNAGKRLTGKVRLVLRSLEAASRRAPIEVEVPNDNGSLIAGSYVRATHKGR